MGKMIPSTRDIQQRTKPWLMEILLRLNKNVPSRLEILVDLGGPQTYSWVDVDNIAANIRLQARCQAFEDIV